MMNAAPNTIIKRMVISVELIMPSYYFALHCGETQANYPSYSTGYFLLPYDDNKKMGYQQQKKAQLVIRKIYLPEITPC